MKSIKRLFISSHIFVIKMVNGYLVWMMQKREENKIQQ